MRGFFAALAFCLAVSGCASKHYKSQPLGERQSSRVFEYEYPVVWKSIKEALNEYKVENASEEEGLIETQWAYAPSNQKFIELKVNNLPRRKYLQTRYRYRIEAKKQMMGVLVQISSEEEVEKLNEDGSFDTWVEVSDKTDQDIHRIHKMLQTIENKILSSRHI